MSISWAKESFIRDDVVLSKKKKVYLNKWSQARSRLAACIASWRQPMALYQYPKSICVRHGSIIISWAESSFVVSTSINYDKFLYPTDFLYYKL